MRIAFVTTALVLALSGCSGKRAGIATDVARHAKTTQIGWRGVVNDWYDGGIDHRHSCAAVQEAMRHLPGEGGSSYSTVYADLTAYAEKICPRAGG